tara:strand:- start:378 stop:632 length:255 start_codon:yes stop_codon:yes gene_type:complete
MGDINAEPLSKRTICEVHREIYRYVNKMFEDGSLDESSHAYIDLRLKEAFLMAKKMNNKLRQYKHNYDDGWWEKNKFAGEKISD